MRFSAFGAPWLLLRELGAHVGGRDWGNGVPVGLGGHSWAGLVVEGPWQNARGFVGASGRLALWPEWGGSRGQLFSDC